MIKLQQLFVVTVCVFVIIIIRVLWVVGLSSTESKPIEKFDSIEENMVYVEGGTFYMGSPADGGRFRHEVSLDSFWISATEVTQAQWQAVMGKTFTQHCLDVNCGYLYGVGDDYPVYYVTWEEAMEFCRRLSSATGQTYTLPTEAQWEFAARGGNNSQGYEYSGSNSLGEVAWYGNNSGDVSYPVREKSPNELGLYDMSGNVWELCLDWYDCDYYLIAEQHNPQGAACGTTKSCRGGSWATYSSDCHWFDNNSMAPTSRTYSVGFRVVRLP